MEFDKNIDRILVQIKFNENTLEEGYEIFKKNGYNFTEEEKKEVLDYSRHLQYILDTKKFSLEYNEENIYYEVHKFANGYLLINVFYKEAKQPLFQKEMPYCDKDTIKDINNINLTITSFEEKQAREYVIEIMEFIDDIKSNKETIMKAFDEYQSSLKKLNQQFQLDSINIMKKFYTENNLGKYDINMASAIESLYTIL